MIYNLYKHRGETPLECIQRYLALHPEEKKDKWTYAGRLDPMADGVLLAASGDDIKRKEELLGLDKSYDFNILFGFATDSYDILGKIRRVEKVEALSEAELIKIAHVYTGKRMQEYPPFSSKTVGGRALHEWAREEGLEKIEIPSKEINIYRLQFHKLAKMSAKELLGRLLMDIGKVKGDFRQSETLLLWKQILSTYDAGVCIGSFSADVSSGTYIRGIVNDLGNTLGVGACALSITRTSVGEYKIDESIK